MNTTLYDLYMYVAKTPNWEGGGFNQLTMSGNNFKMFCQFETMFEIRENILTYCFPQRAASYFCSETRFQDVRMHACMLDVC